MSSSGIARFVPGFALSMPSKAAVLTGMVLAGTFGSAQAGVEHTFNNLTPINLPTGAGASVYPSTINVAGITGNAVTRVEVELNGLSHSWPSDLNFLLVGPGGQRVMLLSDAGAAQTIINIDLNFTPAAPSRVAQSEALSSATVRPANYHSDGDPGDFSDVFPDPAPTLVAREPADLTVFDGTNPNGTWSLYIYDDFPSDDGGSLNSGWTLKLTAPTVFTVTKTADTNDGTCNADCSLREAMAAAAAGSGSGDLIRFSPLFDHPQTITLNNSQLDIEESMSIQGPGADLLTISGNHTIRFFQILGGHLVNISGLTLRDGYHGTFGGGIYSDSAYLYMRNVAVAGSRAVGTGGGISVWTGFAQFTACTFSDNESDGRGSAILVYAQGEGDFTEVSLINTTLSGNRSLGDNGALTASAILGGKVEVEVVNSTIAHNSGVLAGGIYLFTQDPTSTTRVTLRNSIVANPGFANFSLSNSEGGPTTLTSLGFNLTNEDPDGHLDHLNDIVGVDPRLGPLTNNGGQTESHALMGGSPALDAGEQSGYMRDQRGQVRMWDTPGVDTAAGGDDSDIGALEMQVRSIVTFYDDAALRQTIVAANAAAPAHSDILFDKDWFSTPRIINLESALPAIATSVNIVGPGPKFADVHRWGGGTYRIFEVINEDGREFSVSGLTISNGSWPGGGGGIFSYARTTLTEVAVFNNFSTASVGGGADLRRATIKNSTFGLNSATGLGGGLHIGGTGFAPGHVRIINSTFNGNVGGAAPGIALTSQFGQTNTLEVINSTITGNSGTMDGGLRVHTTGGGSSVATAIVRNSIVAGNSTPNLNATTSGGGASVIDSRGYNLTNDATATYLDQATDKINSDPLLVLVPDINNDNGMDVYRLAVGSPAIDAGGYSGYLSDQLRAVRPRDQGDIVNAAGGNGSDIGAIEMLPEFPFKNGFED